MVGDVNNLKAINDTQGHLSGDALLSKVAEIMKNHISNNAFAARIGGDEFVILVPNSDSKEALRTLACIEQDCAEVKGEKYGTPSVSWGYAVMQSADQIYNDVFTKADAMMYEAKRQHFSFRSSGLVPAATKSPESTDPPPDADDLTR
jgi:diguanylate cyclase (GGDEF)-like protein